VREITGKCQSTLIKIFKLFQDIDDIFYDEGRRHIQDTESHIKEWHSNRPIRLTDIDLAVVAWRRPDPPISFALGMLADMSCVPVWRKILDTLIEYQERDSWMLAKQRALDILQERDRIAPLFDDIQEELIDHGDHELCDSLHQKLNLLERFTAVYNALRRPSTENDQPAWEPTYNTYDVPKLQKPKFVANAYPNLQPQVRSIYYKQQRS
jgi:hypothetical protein